jgi:hypothetical protein
MRMKTCNKCNEEKELAEFYSKTKNSVQAYCKKCFNKYCMERWIQKKKDAIEYLGGSCKNCGYKKFYGALEFHHKDPNEKDFDWNKLRLRRIESIKKELDKCDLLCSNCHREEHNKIRQQ